MNAQEQRRAADGPIAQTQKNAMASAPNTPSASVHPSAEPAPIDHKAVLLRLLTPGFIDGTFRGSLLMRAAATGDAELMRLVLPQSDRMQRAGGDAGDMPLSVAAAAGHAECVRLLLEERASDQCEARFASRDGDWRSIDHAIANGRWDCVKLLAPHTDLNDRGHSSSRRFAPLAEAARQGRLDMLEFFLPLIDLTTPSYWTPKLNWLELALEQAAGSDAPGVLDCLRWISKRPETRMELLTEGNGALFKAIEADCEKNALFLLPFFGANTQRIVRSEWASGDERVEFHTPLSWAIEKHAAKTVEALLPLTEQTLAQTDPYIPNRTNTSKALFFALDRAASIALWDKKNLAGIENSLRVVDAVGAYWARLSGSDGHPKETDSEYRWLTEANLADSRWERFPRWRASLEACVLADAMNGAQNAAQTAAQTAAQPAPSSESAGAGAAGAPLGVGRSDANHPTERKAPRL